MDRGYIPRYAPWGEFDGDAVVGPPAVSSAESERHSELVDRLAMALEAGGLGTWRVDNATGTVTIDEPMAALFGITEEEFGGTFEALAAHVHPDDVPRLEATATKLRIDKAPFEVEYRVIWPDGSIHWLHGRGKVLTDEHGEVTGTVGCIGDVTPRKLLEAASMLRTNQAERAAEEERLQRARFEYIIAIDNAVLEGSDYREIMRRAASAAVPRLGDWCSIHFVPEPGMKPVVHVAHSDPAKLEWAEQLQQRFPYEPDAPTGVPAVIRTGQLEFIPYIDRALVDAAIEAARLAERADEIREVIEELSLASVMTVPMRTPSGVIGAIQFLSAESKRHFDQTDLALAHITSSRVAVALESAWTTEQHRVIASTLQAALLPASIEAPPGTTVAARYWAVGAATEVGGDFYDLFPIPGPRWAVVIGDVCGTGPEAAAVVAKARHTVRAAATHDAGHAEVLDWVNGALRAGHRDLFCTLFYGTLASLGSGRFRLEGVSGGHPLPILVHGDGTAEFVGHFGTLLGVVTDVRSTLATIEIGPGDTLVMYTDGVNDVAPPHDLTDEALLAIVRAACAGAHDADTVADRIGRAIEDILAIPLRQDDVALLVVRVDDR